MKELTKYSRLAGYLEKLYDKLNGHYFDGQLDRPVITIQSSSRSYGHYTLYNAWSVKGEGYREINIAAGTLNRPIEYTVCTLLHEMVHQYNHEVLNVQDTSRGGTYHNKLFRQAAETHGLIVERSDKYGWSVTSPSDGLLEWILDNDVQEIKLTRNDHYGIRIAGGNAAANGGTPTPTTRKPTYRYTCPCCHNVVRSTQPLKLICNGCLAATHEAAWLILSGDYETSERR